MRKPWHHLYIARVCVEAETPLSIQTGQADLSYDTSLVRDANGLPALPSTTIRGVLRHLYQDQHDAEDTHNIFGFAKVNSNDPDDKTSSLQISWGVIHNSDNIPVSPLHLISEEDTFLEELMQSQPIKRERVRLNHLGCAEEARKFDVTACPKGARFTFEIKYWSDQENDPKWDNLLRLLTHPQFRLGHSTRSGFGALRLHTLHQGHYDLTDPHQAQTWRDLPRDLSAPHTLKDAVPNASHHNTLEIKLSLTAEGLVLIGGGDVPVHQKEEEDDADLIMQSENFITWKDNKVECFYMRFPIIPASAIKGPIAHRILFHFNKLEKNYADKLDKEQLELTANRNSYEELVTLLGAAKGDELLKSSDYKDGKAGQLIINDIYLNDKEKTMQLWHNRIDRFTGGVIDGALFTEEVLFEPKLEFSITLVNPERLSKHTKLALAATLDDLSQGRLAIGAGGSRGLGSFSGDYSPKPLFRIVDSIEEGAN